MLKRILLLGISLFQDFSVARTETDVTTRQFVGHRGMKSLLIIIGLLYMLVLAVDAAVLYEGVWPYEIKNGEAYLVNPGHEDGQTNYKMLMWGNIQFPTTLGGCPLVEIGDQFLSGCPDVTNVVIPSTVRRIGEYAFADTGIKSIYLPKCLNEIGAGAFSGCNQILSITIPDNVSYLGWFALSCEQMQYVYIGSSVSNVNYTCFQGCPSSLTIEVSKDNPYYYEGLFYSLDQKNVIATLRPNIGKQIQIKEGVTHIADYAFHGAKYLENITFPNSLVYIGDEGFSSCPNLQSIKFGEKIRDFGEGAFCGCSSLKEVSLPNSVTNMSDYLFSQCPSLQKLHIGKSVESLGWCALWQCDSLSNLTVDVSNKKFVAVDNVLYSKDLKTLHVCPGGVENCNILDSVIDIKSEAFHNSAHLKRVSIPDSVEKLRQRQFYDCYELEEVKLGSGIVRIDFYTFEGCTMLNKIVIPKNVTRIYHGAFKGCVGLQYVIFLGDAPNWDWDVLDGVDADCFPTAIVVEGSKGWGCDIPGRWNGMPIEYCGHINVNYEGGVSPTCDQVGMTGEGSCQTCQKYFENSTIPALGHVEVETKSAKTATCTEDGWTKEVSCSRCKAVLVASTVVPKLGHAEVETKLAKTATCTEDGWTKEVSCSRCKSVLVASTVLQKLGHIEVETKTAKAATCTEDGWTHEVTCSRCKSVLVASTVVPKLGHSQKTTITPIAPTCTEDGRTAEIVCGRCDQKLQASQMLQSYGGHSGAITKHAVTPTSSAAGLTAEITCTRCAQVLQEQKEIPALGYIRNVTARQIWPHKKVEIKYEIADDIEDVASVSDKVVISCGEGRPDENIENFATSGTYQWSVDTTESRDGISSWKSGNYHVKNSSSSMSITVSEAEEISFYWKVSSESNYDELHFYVDDSEAVTAISGTVDWTYVSIELDPSESHTLKWTYSKDGSVDNDSDAGWVDSVVVSYGNNGSTARSIIGDNTCTPGIHRVVWDMETDDYSINKTIAFTVQYSEYSAMSEEIAVNTSSSVFDGMNVSRVMNLGYSPIGSDEAEVLIDGVSVLTSSNSGIFAWQPQTTGTHTLKHVSGDLIWTRTVNVNSLAWDEPIQPDPPTAEDSNIVLGSTVKSFAQTGGSGSIATSGSGTWNASASVDWITIPVSTRNAGLPVVYRVAANTDVEARVGYVYVSGHVFTVTQDGVGGELDSYSADFETDGGADSFNVVVDTETSWTARSNVDWISIDPVSGTGEGAVTFNVAPWNEVSTRVGTITAAGKTFSVNQDGRRMKLSTNKVEENYESHALDVQINALYSTEWDIEIGASWISVVDEGRGKGSGNVYIAVAENPSFTARTGVVRIGTETLTITQSGRPTEALSFIVSPPEATASVEGANGLISVAATPDLPWTAKSGANWLTIMPSFLSGEGNGNVIYTASPNPNMSARTGRITVTPVSGSGLSAAVHAVTQPAASASVSSVAHTFDPAGSSYDVEVTVDDIVNWTVSSSANWVNVDTTTTRIGPGTVTIAVSKNLTTLSRTATVTIAGHVFTVAQSGRSIEVEYEAMVFGTESDSEDLDVHPDGEVTWTAIVSADALSWLTVWGDNCSYDDDGNLVGTGEQTLECIVSDYVGDGTPRTGTITIGDKVIYITQRAYELSINPSATWVDGNAGSGSVSVPASAGDVWNAIATEPWITVANTTGTGSGTVQYTFTENDTGEVRTGRIIISGEEYTITQAARQMVAINAMANGNGGVVSGGGTYELGTDVTLTAVANDGYVFSGWTLPGGTSTVNPLVVTADVDKEIVATFTRIPYYLVNGESVREGTVKSFTAPEAVVDGAGTTKLVCLGTSMYPEKGTSFNIAVTGDISFEWDLWQTNYLVTVEQTAGGTVALGGSQSSATWIASGAEITLTATPAAGNSFLRWNIAQNPDNPVNPVQNNSASLRLCVESPVTVSAEFGVFNDSLADSLDAAELVFKTGGDAQWAASIDSTAQTGYTSARSGAIGVESETWMETTLSGSGTLSFRWKVDCEQDDGGGATWDRLSVFTNNVEAARIDGNSGWRAVTLPVSGGKTTVRWSFYRDDYDDPAQAHENAAWVDGVKWDN